MITYTTNNLLAFNQEQLLLTIEKKMKGIIYAICTSYQTNGYKFTMAMNPTY